MNDNARRTRAALDAAKQNYESAQRAVDFLERSCRHEFGAVVSDPIVRPGYTEPGDAPGTMGIDHRSSFYVPEQRTPRWTRTCRRNNEGSMVGSGGPSPEKRGGSCQPNP